jgi:DNA-binding transcriptional regulator PaaX
MASGNWTLLSNHGHVLVALSRDPSLRIRDLVDLIGITERSVRAIVMELRDSGYITIIKRGRRNEYSINEEMNFRHPAEATHQVTELLKIFKNT